MSPHNLNINSSQLRSNDSFLVNTIALRKTLALILNLLQKNDDNAVSCSLKTIMEFFEVDRVFIGYLGESINTIGLIHEISSEEGGKFPDSFYEQLATENFTWWTGELKTKEAVCIADTSEMSAESRKEQRLMLEVGVISHLVVPTFYEEKINGFIGIECTSRKRQWTALDIEYLRILSDLLSLVIEQERTKTELKQEVLKQEAKFRLIFEKLPIGVEVYDKDGILIDINQADMDIFGITKEKALGTNMFANPNVTDEIKQKALKGEEAGMVITYNFDAAVKNGFYDWEEKKDIKYIRAKCTPMKNQDGNILGFLFLVIDDTENYLKSEQIQSNLAKLQIAVDTGDAFIWEYDLESGELNVDFGVNNNPDYLRQIEAFNNRYADGSSSFIETIHPDDFEKVVIDGFQRLVEGRIDSFTTTFRRIYNGEILWYNCNVRTYKYNAEGKPARIVSYMVNTTEQHQKELELIKIKEADKLKTTFLANMSHEIRTPLNAIVGFSNILSEITRTEQTAEYVKQINENNELLLQLVNDILDFSKLETGEMEYSSQKIDIKQLCREVCATFQDKTGEVELIFDPTLPEIIFYSDKNKVRQAMENILGNALKFTPEGSITLQYCVTDNRMLRVEIIDTGVGIAEEDQAQIFDNFYKGNVFQQGVGLGLPITKAIIEFLRGTLGVESRKGEGSLFWFMLPLE